MTASAPVRADVLVVGAGPAGLAAADAAAAEGLKVVLAGRRARLGGAAACRLGRPGAPAELERILTRLRASELVTVLAPGTAIAAFDDRYVIDCGERAVEVTAAASVLATGAYERAVVFPGNDRPGVMLASGLRRLVLEDGVLGDRVAAFVVADESGLQTAAELHAAGMRIAAIVDLRRAAGGGGAPPGVPVIAGARVTGVKGRGAVTGLGLEVGGSASTIRCQVVAMSGGWQRADELRFVATSDGDAVVVGERAVGLEPEDRREGPLPPLQGVGAVVGSHDLEAALAEGASAGAWAARDGERAGG